MWNLRVQPSYWKYRKNFISNYNIVSINRYLKSNILCVLLMIKNSSLLRIKIQFQFLDTMISMNNVCDDKLLRNKITLK